MAKISDFMVGIIIGSFVLTGMVLYMSQISYLYGGDFDNTTYTTYNKVQEINELVEDINDNNVSLTESGFVDAVTGYFVDAYKSLQLTRKSITIFTDMTQQASNDVEIGFIGGPLQTMIGGVVLIVIVIGVILSAFIKWAL